jgi:amino acid adenylation domain-containing protein
MNSLELSGLALESVAVETYRVKFDMTLLIDESKEELRMSLRYRLDLFDDTTIRRMLAHYATILGEVVSNPKLRVSELQILSESERYQLTVEWNGAGRDSEGGGCIHEQFHRRVELNPDTIALVSDLEALTYHQLNQRANQVAHLLRARAVGPEVIVGICLESSMDAVVAILGVLKAGGAYLPLDPSYPEQRIEYMIAAAGVEVVITKESIGKVMTSRALNLDTAAEELGCCNSEELVSKSSSDNLAYVIFTSGPTGNPKGVLVEHEGVCNLAEAQGRAIHVSRGSRVLQFASYSFDASVSELFVALLNSATLVIGRQEQLAPMAGLTELLNEQRITVVTLPPTVASLLNEQKIESLESIVVAGERCTKELVNRFRKAGRVFNSYGPTEATTCATIGACREEKERPSIGRTIANVRMYILDDLMSQVGISIAGEAFLSGAGLARGYLRRAEQTAERFVPDPYSWKAGGRLYRTGDLCRYFPDGSIDYIERKDQHVKLRGCGIELAEIEAALMACQMVEQAAVVVKGAGADQTLAGYVVSRAGAELDEQSVRQQLRQSLPRYMVPSELVRVELLPIKSNGKVDREKLALEASTSRKSGKYKEPGSELEKMLTNLWKEILKVDKIGLHDNFFELGGNSIRAAVFANHLQKELGEVVYTVALFEAPTISELALYLNQHHRDSVVKICRAAPAQTNQLPHARVDQRKVAEIRSLIPPLQTRDDRDSSKARKNPSAIFILSPPRSGSTLLRVMLAGHKGLFAPPELELLSFNSLMDRKQAFSGRNSFWLEGTIRAIMQLKKCGANEAKRMMEEFEDQHVSTQEFYSLMQGWIGERRRLVDKTPAYALDKQTLMRAEEDFDRPQYIHLLRHPEGMIRSFKDAKLDQVFFRHQHSYEVRELAELIWVLSHQNILEFLREIPENRRHRVKFEDLTTQPRAVMEELSRFLGLNPEEDMLRPYEEKEERMTNGIHPLSRMLGDVKFHHHKSIDPRIAERWKDDRDERMVGDITLELAQTLGYQSTMLRPSSQSSDAEPRQPDQLMPIVPEARRRQRTWPYIQDQK